MKGYKAFGKGMVCRGKQYKENETFKEESPLVMCERGMHFCENPFDVLDYYDLIDDDGNVVEIAEVEAIGDTLTDKNKTVTNELKIGAKLNLFGFVKASIEWIRKFVDKENDKNIVATSGYGSKVATSGDGSQVNARGENAVVMMAGIHSQAKGVKGTWITLCEWLYDKEEYYVKTGRIGYTKQNGVVLKEDTFYELKNRKFVEAQNE